MNRSAITWLLNSDGTPGYTWSPTSGCSPVSAGCLNCWAKSYHVRYRGGDFGVKLHPEELDEPLRLRKPSTIGVALLGDMFHRDVEEATLDAIFARMAMCPRHTFAVLTKRAERLRAYLSSDGRACAIQRAIDAATVGGEKLVALASKYGTSKQHVSAICLGQKYHVPDLPWPLSNVWLGVSVENQETADERIPILLGTPAAHRWVSYEPAIGPVDFSRWLTEWPFGPDGPRQNALDGIVLGCESGPRRRPFDVAWARSVRDQCKAAGVTYALKQMPIGGRIMEKPGLDDDPEWNLPWVTP